MLAEMIYAIKQIKNSKTIKMLKIKNEFILYIDFCLLSYNSSGDFERIIN